MITSPFRMRTHAGSKAQARFNTNRRMTPNGGGRYRPSYKGRRLLPSTRRTKAKRFQRPLPIPHGRPMRHAWGRHPLKPLNPILIDYFIEAINALGDTHLFDISAYSIEDARTQIARAQIGAGLQIVAIRVCK